MNTQAYHYFPAGKNGMERISVYEIGIIEKKIIKK